METVGPDTLLFLLFPGIRVNSLLVSQDITIEFDLKMEDTLELNEGFFTGVDVHFDSSTGS